MPKLSARGNPYMEGSEARDLIDDYTRQLSAKLDLSTPYRTACGENGVNGTGGAMAEARVNFPAGRFTLPPKVVPSGRVTPEGHVYVAQAVAVDKDGFTLRIARVGGTFSGAQDVTWTATQMTPAGAAG